MYIQSEKKMRKDRRSTSVCVECNEKSEVNKNKKIHNAKFVGLKVGGKNILMYVWNNFLSFGSRLC